MKYYYSLMLIFLSITLFSQQSEILKEKAASEFSKEHYDNAINIYTKLIVNDPSDYSVFISRASCYIQKRLYRKAIDDCSKALTFSMSMNNKYQALYMRGSAYFEYNEWEKAFKDIDSANVVYYDSPGFVKYRLITMYHLKKYAETVKELNLFLKMPAIGRNDTMMAYNMIGFCYVRLDSLSHAMYYADKLYRMDSLADSYLYLRAAIYTNQDNLQKAANCYSLIIKQDSTDSHAFYCRGNTLNSIGAYKAAINDLEKSARMSKQDINSIHYQLGQSYEGLKKYDVAISYYLKCIKANPRSSEFYNQIAWMYFLSKKWEEGLVYVDKALKLDANNSNAYDTRGAIRYKLGKNDEAITDFDAALAIDPGSSNSYYFRARCFLKKKDYAKACADLESLKSLQKTTFYKLPAGESPPEKLLLENCSGKGKL